MLTNNLFHALRCLVEHFLGAIAICYPDLLSKARWVDICSFDHMSVALDNKKRRCLLWEKAERNVRSSDHHGFVCTLLLFVVFAHVYPFVFDEVLCRGLILCSEMFRLQMLFDFRKFSYDLWCLTYWNLFIKGCKWMITSRACPNAFNDTRKFAILIELAENRPIYQIIIAVLNSVSSCQIIGEIGARSFHSC